MKRIPILLGALALAVVPAAKSVAAAGPTATAAGTCKLSSDEKYDKIGKERPTYTRKLTASGGASCSTGHKFIKAYYKCRVASPSPGKSGKCTSKVMGYSCTEKRSNVITSEFDADVSCKKGKARITTSYTQFT